MKQNRLVGLDPQTPKSTQKPNLPDPANVMGDWGTLVSREISFFCMEISNLKTSGFCHQDEIVVSPTLIIQGPQPTLLHWNPESGSPEAPNRYNNVDWFFSSRKKEWLEEAFKPRPKPCPESKSPPAVLSSKGSGIPCRTRSWIWSTVCHLEYFWLTNFLILVPTLRSYPTIMVLWSIVEWSVAGHLTKGETELKNPALGLFEVWLFLVRVSETICFKLRESLPKQKCWISIKSIFPLLKDP